MNKTLKETISNFALLIFFSIPITSSAQNNSKENSNIKSSVIDNSSVEKQKITEKRIGTSYRNNLSAHLGAFDPWAGIYYERLISPYWGFDAAIGLIGASVGTKVYFPKLSAGKISFYIGISEGVLLMVGPKHYIPIGLTYLGKKRYRISLDIGPQIYYNKNEENIIGMTLKLGKLF
jgi:hypothetical protein